jgi:hypothetical protein
MNITPAICLFVVEMEAPDGYRFWSGHMTEDKIDSYINGTEPEYMLSDIDHSAATGCVGTCSDPC